MQGTGSANSSTPCTTSSAYIPRSIINRWMNMNPAYCDCGEKPLRQSQKRRTVTDLCLTRGVHFTMSHPRGALQKVPWQECNLMDERLKFVARLLDGEKMAVVCREFGISHKTGYKLINRYNDSGLEGLTDRSRRPSASNQKLRSVALSRSALAFLQTYGALWKAAAADRSGTGQTEETRDAEEARPNPCWRGRRHQRRSVCRFPAEPLAVRPADPQRLRRRSRGAEGAGRAIGAAGNHQADWSALRRSRRCGARRLCAGQYTGTAAGGRLGPRRWLHRRHADRPYGLSKGPCLARLRQHGHRLHPLADGKNGRRPCGRPTRRSPTSSQMRRASTSILTASS
ncbi:hypothetical protein MES5069_460067 [Mesorhizobium escarrei]|uniref:Insertion element IS150 protein InsJ-like helix-turn-helix domain-containing protein n=1 Tax=Mesorhizobium escarrei TaxID=666018 RepID=A0ABM9E824_9HYPH|nr:hypothetical protein MES5069_460067 [Mesorhizobium escarrei]